MKPQVTLAVFALASTLATTSAQADDLNISGKIFFDYSKHTETGKTNLMDGTINRTYLTTKKHINGMWSSKVTFDSSYDPASKKHNNVFLKTAQVTGKISDQLNIKLGMIATPWIGYEDNLNGHRFVTNSFADTHHMAHSADAGVGVFGNIDMFSYDIVSINGEGYTDTAKTEKTDIEARFGVKPIDGLTIDLGYRDGYKGQYVAGTTETQNTLTQLLVTYGQEGDLSYRVGANVISNNVDDQIANVSITEKGAELWAWVRSGEFGGYVRNESLDFDITSKAIESRNIVSLDYYAAKGAIISLVYDDTTDLNGVSGDSKTTTGVFTQFKF